MIGTQAGVRREQQNPEILCLPAACVLTGGRRAFSLRPLRLCIEHAWVSSGSGQKQKTSDQRNGRRFKTDKRQRLPKLQNLDIGIHGREIDLLAAAVELVCGPNLFRVLILLVTVGLEIRLYFIS